MISAITQMGNTQILVNKGDVILVDFINKHEEGYKLIFKKILYINKESENIFGSPIIEGAEIHATIIKSCVKGKKIRVFKKKRRKGYHKTIGHRQRYTKILIENIIC